MNNGTCHIQCKCEHEFQDKRYGPKTRVANATQKGNDKQTEVRCTVCKSTQLVNKDKVK